VKSTSVNKYLMMLDDSESEEEDFLAKFRLKKTSIDKVT
jgi:hypothetical protein